MSTIITVYHNPMLNVKFHPFILIYFIPLNMLMDIPSTNLGKSAGFFGSTATRTTGDTENFMTFMLCASLYVVIVPVFTKN